MAGKQRYTVDEVCDALNATRGQKTLAGERLGCSDETVNNYEKRYVRVRQVIEHHRNRRLDVAESKLDTAVENGEAWAVMFMLRTVGKSRGYVERQEVSGPDGTALIVEIVRRDDSARAD